MNENRVHYDGIELQKKFTKSDSLQKIIAELEAVWKKQGKVISSVFVNGLRLSESDELRLAATQVDEIHELEIEVEAPLDLFYTTVHSQLALIPELERVAQEVARTFRSQDLSRGQVLMVSLFEGSRWFVDGLISIREAIGIVVTRQLEIAKWDQAEAQFRRVINEALVAMERFDYILLADILEYDYSMAISSWRELLKELGSHNDGADKSHG